MLRAAFVVVVVLFLYLILRVSMIAFGGSAKREATRIERAIDTSTVHAPAPRRSDGRSKVGRHAIAVTPDDRIRIATAC